MCSAYILNISLGNPPTHFSGMIDTGSGLVHLPCSDCKGCKQLAFFNASNSATAVLSSCHSSGCAKICGADSTCSDPSTCSTTSCLCEHSDSKKCQYDIVYGDGTHSQGLVYTDTVRLPGSPSFTGIPLTFGCDVEASQDLFVQAVPALFGIDYQPASLYSQMLAAGAISDSLTICLGDGIHLSDPLAAGFLILGFSSFTVPYATATTAARRIDPATWTGQSGMVPSGLWLQLTSLTLGDDGVNSVGRSSHPVPALLDTGTSFTLLPGAVYRSFLKQLKALVSAMPDNTASYSLVDLSCCGTTPIISTQDELNAAQLDATFPPMVFSFPSFVNGSAWVQLSISASHYMIEVGPAEYAVFVQSSAPQEFAVFGNAMLNHLVVQVSATQ
ncbi:MAG: hypothetical protein WDW38_005570 [Sanguina aurantia]